MDAMHLLGVVGRVALIYLFLLLLLRLSGKRELAQATPMDLLTMLLLSETVSPALTGEGPLAPGLVAASTLIALTIVVHWLTFRSRKVERALEGQAKVLIVDGKVRQDTLRHQRVTNDQLLDALHKQG